MTTTPEPDTQTTTLVRLDCRFGGPDGDEALYVDLGPDALADLLDQLHGYQAGSLPAYTLVTLMARARPATSLPGYREVRVWRIVRAVAEPDGEVLYERTPLRAAEVEDLDRPDLLYVPLTRAQYDMLGTGEGVQIDLPPRGILAGLTVVVRLRER